jgi:negative regulator of flagellin synthesis FlgM
MKISGNGADFIRPEQTREIQRSADEGAAKNAGSGTAPKAERSDKVEISDVARQLAAGSNGVGAVSGARSELSPERVAAIREKILKGAYNSVDVVDQVARKMLASGDI